MIHFFLSLVLACAITLFFPWSAACAENSEQIWVSAHGEILGGNSDVKDWRVELAPFGPVTRYHTLVQGDGRFEFRSVTPGIYELRVLSIRVPSVVPAEASKAHTVSFRQLQHKVPGKAISEQKKGVSALKQHQISVAADHFKNAVTIDPEFADAHNDLGVAYFRLKDYEHSLEHLQKAIQLAPGHQPASENLCLLLLSMKRYTEAGQLADTVLKHGSGSSIAHYALAVSVLAEGGNTGAALDHLRRASDEIPKGHLLAARVLANAGRRTDAAHELEAYLHCSQTGHERPEVEEWLAELKQ